MFNFQLGSGEHPSEYYPAGWCFQVDWDTNILKHTGASPSYQEDAPPEVGDAEEGRSGGLWWKDQSSEQGERADSDAGGDPAPDSLSSGYWADRAENNSKPLDCTASRHQQPSHADPHFAPWTCK